MSENKFYSHWVIIDTDDQAATAEAYEYLRLWQKFLVKTFPSNSSVVNVQKVHRPICNDKETIGIKLEVNFLRESKLDLSLINEDIQLGVINKDIGKGI